MFSNRLIERHDSIVWLPRSSILSPKDFFIMGCIKSKIYGYVEERASVLEELRIKVQDASAKITPKIIYNVRIGIYNRLRQYLTLYYIICIILDIHILYYI